MAKRKELVLPYRAKLKQLFVLNAILRRVDTSPAKAKGLKLIKMSFSYTIFKITHFYRDNVSI
jgi:hypothetical protein